MYCTGDIGSNIPHEAINESWTVTLRRNADTAPARSSASNLAMASRHSWLSSAKCSSMIWVVTTKVISSGSSVRTWISSRSTSASVYATKGVRPW